MAVQFSGINQAPQMTKIKKTPMAEVSFQAKSQADTVSFGMHKKIIMVQDAIKAPGKSKFFGKISLSDILHSLKIYGKKVVDFLKKLNPMKLFKKTIKLPSTYYLKLNQEQIIVLETLPGDISKFSSKNYTDLKKLPEVLQEKILGSTNKTPWKKFLLDSDLKNLPTL